MAEQLGLGLGDVREPRRERLGDPPVYSRRLF
jgi:hypothetical protein